MVLKICLSFSSDEFQCNLIWIGNLIILATILLATYASSASTPAPAKKDSCQKVCTAVYSPICGKPVEGKGTDITFGNQCTLDNYNCEKPDKSE